MRCRSDRHPVEDGIPTEVRNNTRGHRSNRRIGIVNEAYTEKKVATRLGMAEHGLTWMRTGTVCGVSHDRSPREG